MLARPRLGAGIAVVQGAIAMADNPADGHIPASALAGGAIAIGLFNLLIDKGVISRADALGILREAQGFLQDSPRAIDGARVVGSIYERILKGK